jgi:hypothetical protein
MVVIQFQTASKSTRMKSTNIIIALLVLASTMLTSCEMIGDIFKAGVWVGVIVVVGIIALVLWLIGKARK